MYFDFANLPVRDRYKLAVSTIVPRPIAWMVTLDELDRVNAAPFSFFNIFSDDPMVVGHRHRAPAGGLGSRTRSPTFAPGASSWSASSPRRCCRA